MKQTTAEPASDQEDEKDEEESREKKEVDDALKKFVINYVKKRTNDNPRTMQC